MQSDVYVRRLVELVVKNINTKYSNVMLIKHFNTLQLSKSQVEEIFEHEEDIKVLYYEYDSKKMQIAYEPFLQWISQLYMSEFSNEMSVEEFVEKCNVYPLQKKTFECIARGEEIYLRKEDLILSELEYEKKRFIKSIINTFKFIASKKKIFILLNKLHFTGYSTMELVREYIQQEEIKHIGIMLIVNEAYTLPSYVEDMWYKLLEITEKNMMTFDWDTVASRKIDEKQDIFEINISKSKKYITELINMMNTMAFEQAKYYIDLMEQRIERADNSICDEYRDLYREIQAYISICVDDANSAILNTGNYLCDENLSDLLRYKFTYILALAQSSIMQPTLAMKCAEKCKEIAKKIGDQLLILKAESLEILVQNYNWKTVFMCDFGEIVSEEYLAGLEKYGFINMLSYTYANAFENDAEFIRKVINGEEEQVYFKKAIQLGEKNDNTLMLQRSYLKNIVTFSNAGYHEYANKLYRKRMEIVQKEKTKIREVHMHNGLSYGYIITEEYEKACEELNEAINILQEEHSNNDMVETLYNMAVNCMMAGDYYNGKMCLATTFDILKMMGMLSVQFCNASKLYGMMALCCYYDNDEYEYNVYQEKMEIFLKHLVEPGGEKDYKYWNEDMCIYYILKGIREREANDLEYSVEYFYNVKKFLLETGGNMFLYYSFYAYEYSKTCRLIGDEDKARKILLESIEYLDNNKFTQKKKILENYLNGKNIYLEKMFLGPRKHTYAEIKKHAKSVSFEKQLKERCNDIGIIARWQDNMKTDQGDRKTITSNVMISISNTFGLDGGIFLRKVDEKWDIMHSDNLEFNKSKMNVAVRFFKKFPQAFVVNRTDNTFDDYRLIINLFRENSVVSLVGIPLCDDSEIVSIFLGYVCMRRNFTANKVIMNTSNLMMIKAAFSQLDGFYSRYLRREQLKKVNEKLLSISYTDNLTGAYNRQGLKCKIEEIKNKNSIDNILLYMDLDDFKIYNDTYGHSIGDDILVAFARVLKICVSDKGFIVRYGGDEFIALITNTSKKEIISIIDNLYSQCKKGIKQMILDTMKKDIDIPENIQVKCSIGVSMFKSCSSEDVSLAIRHSDEALYIAKKKNKGNCIFWEELSKSEQEEELKNILK